MTENFPGGTDRGTREHKINAFTMYETGVLSEAGLAGLDEVKGRPGVTEGAGKRSVQQQQIGGR